MPRDLHIQSEDDYVRSCRDARARIEEASTSSAAERKQLDELTGRISQMEIEALSTSSALESARTLSEDRDKHHSAALKEATGKVSELEKRHESEQQKWRQQQQATTVKMQELSAQAAAAEKSASASSSSAAEASRNADKIVADLKSQLDVANAAASAAAVVMDQTSAAVADAAQRESRLSDELSTQKQLLQQLQQAHCEQMSAQLQKYTALELQIADVSKQLESSSAALAAALADADSHKTAVLDLRAQLSSAEDQHHAAHRALEAQLAEALAQLDSAVKHGTGNEKKLAEVQSRSDAAASRVADADARIAALQNELERARSDTAAQSKEVNHGLVASRYCCTLTLHCSRLLLGQK